VADFRQPAACRSGLYIRRAARSRFASITYKALCPNYAQSEHPKSRAAKKETHFLIYLSSTRNTRHIPYLYCDETPFLSATEAQQN
jgi:hypothetical protein